MSTMPGIPESTYRLCYRGEQSSQAYIRYRTLPCIQCPQEQPERQFRQADESKLVAKNFRVSSARKGRPKSAERLLAKNDGKVFETKFGPMGMDEITKLYNKRRYATSAQKAGKEFVLLPMHRPVPPSYTKEEKPDNIVLKGRKYEDSREEWQDAVLWDRIQSRAPTERPMTPAKENLLLRRQKVPPLKPEVESKIESLVKTDGLANVFIKKCPRYAGYAPLCPPETRLDDKQHDVITSTMRASYRNFPEEDYMPQHGRKGPLSKTVTLTAPYNPYNKVGNELQSGDKDGRYLRLFTGYPTSSYIH